MPQEKTAGAILYHPRKGILMILRDNKKSIPFPNCWTLPGGHGSKNESAKNIVRREILEELNYKAESLKLFDINTFYNHKQYAFIARINKPLSKLKLNEGRKMDFISFYRIDKIKIGFGLKKVIKKFIKDYKK